MFCRAKKILHYNESIHGTQQISSRLCLSSLHIPTQSFLARDELCAWYDYAPSRSVVILTEHWQQLPAPIGMVALFVCHYGKEVCAHPFIPHRVHVRYFRIESRILSGKLVEHEIVASSRNGATGKAMVF